MSETTTMYDAAPAADTARLRPWTIDYAQAGSGPAPYRALLSEIERASWRPECVCPDGPLDAAPIFDNLTQGLAYARVPADFARKLRFVAERAAIAAERPDLANAPGALRAVATLLRRLASEVTAR